MAGALIVEPSAANSAAHAAAAPALAAMEEEVLVLQHLCFHNRGKYVGPSPLFASLALSSARFDPQVPRLNPLHEPLERGEVRA
jgi:hypothetical protein